MLRDHRHEHKKVFVIITVLVAIYAFTYSIIMNQKNVNVQEPLPAYEFTRNYMPDNQVFYSDDGGVWIYAYSDKRTGDTALYRLGPVELPETEDINDSIQVAIKGILRLDEEKNEIWRLQYEIKVNDNLPKIVYRVLQVQIDERWYYVYDAVCTGKDSPGPDELTLLLGGDGSNIDDRPKVQPGHYRLLCSRCFRGVWSLAVVEFDLKKTDDGYALSV